MIFHGGHYFYCESRHHRPAICIRQARTIAGIASDPGVTVWRAPATSRHSHAVWAPELHWLRGKWYIYFAADDGQNENHRMWVLESETSNPLGKYQPPREIETDGWAIDGTVLTTPDERLFFVWSGWPGACNGQQNLYISPMRDPVTLEGPRQLLSVPDQSWERNAMPICEAPQVLRRNGTLFIVYSASGSWTVDYCLGLLVNDTGDVLNPAAWRKHGPVFQKTRDVWGVGHCSFVQSPCGTEDWILYHSKSHLKPGWHDRDVHAKRFHWTPDGMPDFGSPPSRRRDY